MSDVWAQIALALADWYASHGRRPVWRGRASRYQTAIAEVLLQKTKGGDAEPVWAQIMSRYPTVSSLAEATEHELLPLLSPLGLGRQRTKRLLSVAAALTRGSAVLPGLGPYGSAVVALSQGEEPNATPVDGNVARVVCRLRGLEFERGEPRKKPEVKAAVRALMDTRDSAASQLETVLGLVDLGALVCTPTRPLCRVCPLSTWCVSSLPLHASPR